MLKLSKRLQSIAEQVPENGLVADIGSDHALLPVYLVQSGKVPGAVAGELNEGPYSAALKGVEAAGLSDRIQVRKGNGLAVISPGEAECITIAGMGGSLMSAILSEGLAAGKLQGVRTLVLQPNVGEDLVRRWLFEHRWYLRSELILKEDDKIYEILTAVHEPNADERNRELYDPSFFSLSWDEDEKQEFLFRMGPWLLRAPTDVLRQKWVSETEKLEWVCQRMERSDIEQSKRKLKEIRKDIAKIREVLACLPKDKP
jgi:tRNA (adenine22-N1)-methyltransferase